VFQVFIVKRPKGKPAKLVATGPVYTSREAADTLAALMRKAGHEVTIEAATK
jgi:hypothetical protein